MNAIINFFKTLNTHQAQANDVFRFNGGIHPPEHKAESTQLPIATLKTPKKLTLPLRQHVGNIPKIKVQVGDRVLKGQLLAEPEGAVSAAIHAPTSGIITAIADAIIPHPSGLPDRCISLTPDGLDEWCELQKQDWRHADKNELISRLRMSGIVGLGGATFPTHIKLRANGKSGVHTLVINAAECEPYITCDDMLMRERADQIAEGIALAQHLLGAPKCVIGIEDNKPQAFAAMHNACAKFDGMTVSVVPTLYPSGDARRLIHLLLGIEIPHDKRSTDVGIQVFNVATVLALYRYFEFGEPSISRIVSMTGNVNTPQNFEVLFGTPVQDLVNAAGGAKANTSHYIMGGPMMGFDLPINHSNAENIDCDVPITKAANCIIAASPGLFAEPPPAMPCIRCARCADACPVNLQPQELYWFAKSDNFEKARDYDLFDCIECGCCTYVCPSNIPLVQYYRYAKSEIIATDKAKEAADLARERNEFKLLRTEREKQERTQKHAQRAEAGKAEAKKLEATQTEASEAGTKQIIAEISTETNAKINNTELEKTAAATPATLIDEEAKKRAKQVAIAAAIERAKALKAAALVAGDAPKNITPSSQAVIAEIKEIEARRKEFLPAGKSEEN